jgi:hypothetical protein
MFLLIVFFRIFPNVVLASLEPQAACGKKPIYDISGKVQSFVKTYLLLIILKP